MFGLRKHQQMAGHSVESHARDARCVIWVKTRKNSEISRQVLMQAPCPVDAVTKPSWPPHTRPGASGLPATL